MSESFSRSHDCFPASGGSVSGGGGGGGGGGGSSRGNFSGGASSSISVKEDPNSANANTDEDSSNNSTLRRLLLRRSSTSTTAHQNSISIDNNHDAEQSNLSKQDSRLLERRLTVTADIKTNSYCFKFDGQEQGNLNISRNHNSGTALEAAKSPQPSLEITRAHPSSPISSTIACQKDGRDHSAPAPAPAGAPAGAPASAAALFGKNDNTTTTTAGPLKPINLPPIYLSTSDNRASSSSSSLLSSTSNDTSTVTSTPLLPSLILEPQLLSLHGRSRAPSPSISSLSSSSSPSPSSSSFSALATDNTPAPATTRTTQSDAKPCQSSPPRPSISSPPAPLPSSSSSARSSSPNTQPVLLPPPARQGEVSTRGFSTSALPSDFIGIESPAADGRLVPLSNTTTLGDSTTARSSKKRSLDEYQTGSEDTSSTTAKQQHPLAQSITADSIASPPSTQQTDHSGARGPSVLPLTQEESVSHRIPESNLIRRPDIDGSVESTIVLAHRAITAIKNQSLPRPKTIGPTFTIGKPGTHPFGITRKSHDEIMEAEDESDNESTTTTSSDRPRIMPWHRPNTKANRDESPLPDPFADCPDEPLRGPMPLASSSPNRVTIIPGVANLIRSMGGGYFHDEKTAQEARKGPIEVSESDDQDTKENSSQADESNQTNGSTNKNQSSISPASQIVSPVSRLGDGGSGDGGEDPNKRSRKPSEHEEDNGSENEDRARIKRIRIDQNDENEESEPQQAEYDQGGAATHLFGLSKGRSPPPQPSGPPTVESIASTAPTMDTVSTYRDTASTPMTICENRSDYHKSPIETANTLPPIGVPFSPGRTSMSPGIPHTPLPGVSRLFAAADMKHSIEHSGPPPNHVHHSGKVVRPRVVSHVNVEQPPHNQPPNTRDYPDSHSRPIQYVNPAQQYRAVTPKSRTSPNGSPIENRNAPIAPAPPGFSGQVLNNPLSQYTYFPPGNLGRPERRAPLPPLQTGWSSSMTPSEPGSAKTPTSKASKRGRNGTPKNSSTDSTQNSPSVPGGYRCTKEGCTAAPFSTQYLLNSHANVHSDERPHFCPVPGCPRGEGGKGFKRKNEMIRHGLVHQSPGYVCPFCPDKEHRYPRPDNLQRHVKAHHRDKNGDDPMLREVLAVRPEGGQRGRRRRMGPST
ncbi:hypothetical protein ABW19_dt0208193 [Dactylella cylindrospora]|nr:hypothetical protein ABW19_dt0208193 [Dactylella cylindrospora]